jgi:hypothetical protein
MSQKDVDSLKQGVEDTLEWSKKQLTHAEEGFNSLADDVAARVRSGLSYSLNQMAHARSQAEVRSRDLAVLVGDRTSAGRAISA